MQELDSGMTTENALGYTEEASEELDDMVRLFQEDIDMFQDFREKVLSQPVSNGGQMFNSGNQVLDIYSDEFFNQEDVPDEARIISESHGLSVPAADLLYELANVPGLDSNEALGLVKNIDKGVEFNSIVKKRFKSFSRYPIILREKVIEDAEIEQESLRKYTHEVGDVRETLQELNEDNPIPVGLDSALEVVDELERLDEKISQLKNRRIQELERRDEIFEGYFNTQEEELYSDKEFQRPVIQELEYLNTLVDEAYNGLVLEF